MCYGCISEYLCSSKQSLKYLRIKEHDVCNSLSSRKIACMCMCVHECVYIHIEGNRIIKHMRLKCQQRVNSVQRAVWKFLVLYLLLFFNCEIISKWKVKGKEHFRNQKKAGIVEEIGTNTFFFVVPKHCAPSLGPYPFALRPVLCVHALSLSWGQQWICLCPLPGPKDQGRAEH